MVIVNLHGGKKALKVIMMKEVMGQIMQYIVMSF